MKKVVYLMSIVLGSLVFFGCGGSSTETKVVSDSTKVDSTIVTAVDTTKKDTTKIVPVIPLTKVEKK
jgi:hypothetical protein